MSASAVVKAQMLYKQTLLGAYFSMSRFIVFAFTLTWAVDLFASNVWVTVIDVIDGDTLKVRDEIGNVFVVRIHGIDAPELDQPYGLKAKGMTSALCLSKQALLKIVSNRDKYGRVIADVECNNRDVAESLVTMGLAWWYAEYGQSVMHLSQTQEKAKGRGLFIWSENNPVPPWQWRSRFRHTESAESDVVKHKGHKRAIPGWTTGNCSDCSGNGWYDCTMCDGSGTVYRFSELRSCILCSGSGRRECISCLGKGTITWPSPSF